MNLSNFIFSCEPLKKLTDISTTFELANYSFKDLTDKGLTNEEAGEVMKFLCSTCAYRSNGKNTCIRLMDRPCEQYTFFLPSNAQSAACKDLINGNYDPLPYYFDAVKVQHLFNLLSIRRKPFKERKKELNYRIDYLDNNKCVIFKSNKDTFIYVIRPNIWYFSSDEYPNRQKMEITDIEDKELFYEEMRATFGFRYMWEEFWELVFDQNPEKVENTTPQPNV